MIRIIFCLSLLLTSSCKKNKLSELDKLPPATQTGAKTFGCLINGKAWVPGKDDWSSQSPLKFYYDNSNGGQFSMQAELKINSRNEKVIIGIDSCSKTGGYSYYRSDKHTIRFAYYNYNNPGCLFSTVSDSTIAAQGTIDINRFGLSIGVISGTFEFSLSKPGCETIQITNGRFDAKL